MAGESAPRKIGAGAGKAAVRQGAAELGLALRAFPESIQVSEPGQLFSPTQGEIAEANRGPTLDDRIRDGLARTAGKQQPEKGMDRE